jgi:Co/Zn/Cd efflux system component
VWLCTRNDAIGNLAVMLAASGVFASGTGWPDLAVAVGMATLALSSSYRVIRQAVGEIRSVPRLSPAE